MRSLILAVAVLLAGCRVDTIAPVNLSDIDKAVTTKEPAEVTARLLLTFKSKIWCEDMGASLVVALQGSGLNMSLVSCAQAPDGADWHGELRMPVRLASLSNSRDTNTGAALGELALLEVKADANKPGSVSLVARLDAPRLNAARERLLSLPVAQNSDDASTLDLSVSIMMKNDLAKDAILSVDAMTTESDPLIELPAGGIRTVTLSKAGMEKLLREQSIELLSVDYSAN